MSTHKLDLLRGPVVLSEITEGSTPPQVLSGDDCRALLARSRFAHLAFTRHSHVEAVPIRFAFVDGWLYFRANGGLRAAIAHNPWAVVSVAETLDPTTVDSVVASGGCYGTEPTHSAADDAAALRGILRLRDPQPVDGARAGKAERTSLVFRMHVDQLRGFRTLVPARVDHLADSIDARQLRSPVPPHA